MLRAFVFIGEFVDSLPAYERLGARADGRYNQCSGFRYYSRQRDMAGSVPECARLVHDSWKKAVVGALVGIG